MDTFFLLTNATALTEFIYSSPYGIVVLFLFTVFANASIFLPISVEPAVFLVGAFAPNLAFVLMVGIVTGIAAGIGEMSGYILGMFGLKTLQKFSDTKVEKIFEMGEKLANKGIPLIIVGAFTPFPFDIIGIAAGVIHYDPKKFFAAAVIGKILRYTLVAFAGFYGLAWVNGVFLI